MIFLDTNIIIDLVNDDKGEEAEWSRLIYRTMAAHEQFACNLIVVAEFAAHGASQDRVADAFDRFRIEILDLVADGAFAAGRAHREYRRRGGGRTAILADFLIAAHAAAIGATLMTRDRRLSSYFPNLTLITPESYP